MSDADRLRAIYEALDEGRQQSLLEFAEFLQQRSGAVVEQAEIGEPEDIPRPDDETVVGAIKRLKQTYPMIESMSVFSSASSLMTEHMVQGRDAVEVIDEMEVIFERAYIELKES